MPARAAAASRARGTGLGGRLSPRGGGGGGGGRACGAEPGGRGGREEAVRGAGKAGRRRRGRGRRAAHWPAGPGAGGCAAARGLGPSPREPASAASYPCPPAKMAGRREEEVGEPAPRGEEGGSQSQPPARGRRGGGGRKGRSRSQPALTPSSLHPLIHSSFQPSSHSFIHPSTHAFIH